MEHSSHQQVPDSFSKLVIFLKQQPWVRQRQVGAKRGGQQALGQVHS